MKNIDGQKCTHCGGSKHTWETCFKIHGYPEWWYELQAKKKRDGEEAVSVSKDRMITTGQGANSVGQASVATSDMTLSLIPAEAHNVNAGTIILGTSTKSKKAYDQWILGSL
ncbi:conserved hypothetical protein [Ricinus communis]|uniref:Uncharacterized protein n=1 Tax=Ricinus communis TaxID=3988 RepID=B9RPH1_RICCO|nr:conserved hypothetical protein [Ricinus communis]